MHVWGNGGVVSRVVEISDMHSKMITYLFRVPIGLLIQGEDERVPVCMRFPSWWSMPSGPFDFNSCLIRCLYRVYAISLRLDCIVSS